MNCPKCRSINNIKNGQIRGTQRYKCKACNYNYTAHNRVIKRSFGDFVPKTHGDIDKTIQKWAYSIEKKLESLQNQEEGNKVLKLDKLHSYINGQKAIAEHGVLWLDMGKDSSNILVIIGNQDALNPNMQS